MANLARIIHDECYCNRRYAAATSLGASFRLPRGQARPSWALHTVSSMLRPLGAPRAHLPWRLGGFVTNSREQCGLGLLEGIRLPDAAVPLDHPIMRSLFGDQVQGSLKGLARRPGAESLLGSLQLGWIQPGRHLNKGHVPPPVGQNLDVVGQRSSAWRQALSTFSSPLGGEGRRDLAPLRRGIG